MFEAAALAVTIATCGAAAAEPVVSNPAESAGMLKSHRDGAGTTTYWGEGASYEIVGPGVTVFFLRRDDGAVVAPMIRVAYVGDRWMNLRDVTFTVGERSFGPFEDVYRKPARIEAGASLVVETLLFKVDTDEKWRMLEAISESYALGRPVIVVLDGDAPYGIELDRASKRATDQVMRAWRDLAVRTH